MIAINMTYNQVLDIVQELTEAERLVRVGGPAGRSYYRGQADAYRNLLRNYSDEEILEMINEIKGNGDEN